MATTAVLLAAPPAQAEILDQRTIDFQDSGAYAIVHYGVDSEGHYLQFYLHDTLADGRCAVAIADFQVDQGLFDHHHIDPGRVWVCDDGAQAWSERWHPYPNNDDQDPDAGIDGWEITGIRWAAACWQDSSGTRGCTDARGEQNVSFHDIPMLP
ncbi:hypothetical protein AB0I98_49795 [Streptomyces sp. NPDC050211]|uniref:hypothetical protein n=1 Tax=Streptomyces sp. NPDC050211 TaxID=3154932 RepID=UPI003433172B